LPIFPRSRYDSVNISIVLRLDLETGQGGTGKEHSSQTFEEGLILRGRYTAVVRLLPYVPHPHRLELCRCARSKFFCLPLFTIALGLSGVFHGPLYISAPLPQLPRSPIAWLGEVIVQGGHLRIGQIEGRRTRRSGNGGQFISNSKPSDDLFSCKLTPCDGALSRDWCPERPVADPPSLESFPRFPIKFCS